MARQLVPEKVSQLFDVELDLWLGHDVASQTFIAWLILSYHQDRLTDCGMLPEYGLYLTQLDAETVQLHLIVEPPKVLDVSVSQIPTQIARPVQSRSSFATVRMRNEALRCQLRLIQIASRYTRSTDVDLSRLTPRNRLAMSIQ